MANKRTVKDKQAKQFGELLNVQIQSASSEGKMAKVGRFVLALACILGAFAIALILVVEGPPQPDPPTLAKATSGKTHSGGKKQQRANQPKRKGKAKPQGKRGQRGQGRKGAGSKGQKPQTTGKQQPKAAAPGTGGSEATLSEDAPWAFAIVALVVGAFLAAGQSIGFGGASTARSGKTGQNGEDGSENPDDEESTQRNDEPPATPPQGGTGAKPTPGQGR